MPFVQNFNLKFTEDAKEFCLCGQHPLSVFPTGSAPSGISSRGSYTMAAGASNMLHQDHHVAFYTTVSPTNGLFSF